jgi:RNA recognition motif-containing protein
LIKLSVHGLPKSTTKASLITLFSVYGTVCSLKLVKGLFSGECKGFAALDMEGHEACAAIAALDNSDLNGSVIRVGSDRGRKGRGGKRR